MMDSVCGDNISYTMCAQLLGAICVFLFEMRRSKCAMAKKYYMVS